jgi:GntR family transcriptional regulator, transcriptional repressor for pyruvate dehydrogenase complex
MGNATYFQTLEKSRLSDEIARQMVQVIREGRYQPGQVLPPEREMAVQFNVSRPVLREALRILEIQGLVEIRHGKGAYVKSPITDILNIPIEYWLAENYPLLLQFYEARLSIEPVCAALAAERATDEDIAYLRQLMSHEAALTQEAEVSTFVSVDIDLHTAITRMSGNTFLEQMMNSLINPETDMRKIVLRLPNHLPVAHGGHSEIVEAISRRDPQSARQAMIDALEAPLQILRDFLGQKESGNG